MDDEAWMVGRLRAGPFAVADRMDLLGLMALHGLKLSDDTLLMDGDAAPRIEFTASRRGGCNLIAQGMSVRAYFVDEEGLEIDRDRLEAFLLDAVAPNTTFSIVGRHQSTPDAVFLNSTEISHDGSIVTFKESQICSKADGTDIIIAEPEASHLDRILSGSMI